MILYATNGLISAAFTFINMTVTNEKCNSEGRKTPAKLAQKMKHNENFF